MALPKDLRFSPRGLWMAPATIEAPKGGMLRADECVLRRNGLLDPRPGMPKTAVWTYDATYTHAERLIAGPPDTYLGIEPHVSIQDQYRVRWNNNTEVLRPNSGTMVFPAKQPKGQRAQGNVYLTTRHLRKVDEAGGAAAYEALPPTAAVLVDVGGTGVALDPGKYVAYRVVVRRTDAAGLITRSAPSGRAVASTTTTSKEVGLKILLHAGLAAGMNSATYVTFFAGDVVEVYRTLNETTTTPTDELYKVGEVELAQADVDAGYVELTDNTPDDETQNSLYTNETQGGIEAANTPPPAGKALAMFNGSLFVGNTTYRPQLTIGRAVLRTGFAVGSQIGVRPPGAGPAVMAVTNGDATATVADTSDLRPGMILSTAAPDFAGTNGYVRILSITNGTTLELSHNWDGVTGSISALFLDSIRISDGVTNTYFPAHDTAAVLSSMRSVDHDGLTEADPLGQPSLVLVDILDDDTDAVTIYDASIKRFVLTGLDEANGFNVWATNGASYSPVLPEPTEVQGYEVSTEAIVNGLAWSNNREPSHFTDVNFEQVGGDKDALLALHAIKNCLLVFKADGVYRVSGAGAESGFRFDELDKNVRILTPYATAEYGDKVLAWADTGVYLCDENGCENISDQRISDLLNPLEASIGVGSTSALGAWACANRRADEFCLSVPTLGALTTGSYLLVYNMTQQGWTKWFSSGTLRHGITLNAGLAVLDGTSVRLERDPNLAGYLPWLDEATAVTVSDVTGLQVTIAGGSGWTPAVGDVLLRGAVYARVLTVTSATVFTVDLTVTTGAASAYVAATAVLTPIASTAGDPSALKIWGDGAVVWDSLKGVTHYTTSWTSTLSDTPVSSIKTVATTPATTRKAESFRITAPVRHARCTRIYPSLTIRQAGSEWSFSALSLSYRPMSSRVRIR